jgi:hypothetical protein
MTGADEGHVTADDLDRELLEQLHAATLKASDSCFELKKLCATVLVPAGTLVAVFTNRTLDASVFVAGIAIVVAFWLADTVSYYYQRKLRAMMTPIWARRASRCVPRYTHIPSPAAASAIRAAFNASMTYYLILGILVTLGLLLFEAGVIS